MSLVLRCLLAILAMCTSRGAAAPVAVTKVRGNPVQSSRCQQTASKQVEGRGAGRNGTTGTAAGLHGLQASLAHEVEKHRRNLQDTSDRVQDFVKRLAKPPDLQAGLRGALVRLRRDDTINGTAQPSLRASAKQAMEYESVLKQLMKDGEEALAPSGWRMVSQKGNVILWKRTPPANSHGREYPCHKLYTVLDAPPAAVMDLVEDSSRIREYNKYSKGRTDIEFLGPRTKIVRNLNQPPLTKKPHEFCTIMHVVTRGDGSQVMYTRFTEHPAIPHSHHYLRSEIILGVTEVRPVPGDPKKTQFTTVSHVKSAGVPPFVAHQVGAQGLVDFASSLEAVLTGKVLRK